MAAKNGDTVRVHYTGSLDDGTVFDSSRGREPLEAVLGGGMLIDGFEKALLGMDAGDTLTVRIPPEEAYGSVLEEAVITVPRDHFPPHLSLEKGMMLELTTDAGELEVRVADITDTDVVLDANHPLAGQTLTFAVEIIEIL